MEKSKAELRRAALVKAARAAIRTRHAIAADAELNVVLPRMEAAFDREVQRGVLPADVDLMALLEVALSATPELP